MTAEILERAEKRMKATVADGRNKLATVRTGRECTGRRPFGVRDARTLGAGARRAGPRSPNTSTTSRCGASSVKSR